MSHAFPDRSFQSPSPRRSTIDIEEQRAWVGFYKRVGRDVALAAEVMAQLDGDAEMKRRHLALYLSCKQSIRVHKARQARDKRIGCPRRSNFDPPCRLNFDPGLVAGIA